MRINAKISIAMAAGALALVSACGGHGDTTIEHEGMSSSTPAAITASAQPSATFNDADVMFAQMMIPHHEQAVDMAGLAPERASDPGIKELAAKIKAAKGAEFDKLFAQDMIAHHKGAIEMARTEQAGGSNLQAKALAKTIETTQQAEVTQLQKILDRL
jgi:uncharacterized protein (DUF305 family)